MRFKASFILDYVIAPIVLVALIPVVIATFALLISGMSLVALSFLVFKLLEAMFDFVDDFLKKENDKCNQVNLE